MSMIQINKDEFGKFKDATSLQDSASTLLTPKAILEGKYEQSQWIATPEEMEIRSLIIRHFGLGYVTMYTPRVEFNDLCVLDRMQIDQMSWNTYQPNNGGPMWGDELNSWRSRALKPVVRNKCISIAAHATARRPGQLYQYFFARGHYSFNRPCVHYLYRVWRSLPRC